MHELPPMMHIRRQTVLDVHHNILPETARIDEPAPMLAAAQPLAEFPRFSIPAPDDLVLHSRRICSTKANGNMACATWSISMRCCAPSADPAFWGQLIRRAETLGLGRPLYYGLRHARTLARTPLPQGLVDHCPGRPAPFHSMVMSRLFDAAFATAHASCRTPLSGTAAWMLYVRSHWLRMPPHLLAPHLVRKSWAVPRWQDVAGARAVTEERFLARTQESPTLVGKVSIFFTPGACLTNIVKRDQGIDSWPGNCMYSIVCFSRAANLAHRI